MLSICTTIFTLGDVDDVRSRSTIIPHCLCTPFFVTTMVNLNVVMWIVIMSPNVDTMWSDTTIITILALATTIKWNQWTSGGIRGLMATLLVKILTDHENIVSPLLKRNLLIVFLRDNGLHLAMIAFLQCHNRKQNPTLVITILVLILQCPIMNLITLRRHRLIENLGTNFDHLHQDSIGILAIISECLHLLLHLLFLIITLVLIIEKRDSLDWFWKTKTPFSLLVFLYRFFHSILRINYP